MTSNLPQPLLPTLHSFLNNNNESPTQQLVAQYSQKKQLIARQKIASNLREIMPRKFNGEENTHSIGLCRGAAVALPLVHLGGSLAAPLSTKNDRATASASPA
jgi:alpha-D-ribose 1-methylphosphonate 5-triphosphate synthase subunit PhnL